jgi:hypothetical protein
MLWRWAKKKRPRTGCHRYPMKPFLRRRCLYDFTASSLTRKADIVQSPLTAGSSVIQMGRFVNASVLMLQCKINLETEMSRKGGLQVILIADCTFAVSGACGFN